MGSTRARPSCGSGAALALLLVCLCGCTIGRLYVGSEIPSDVSSRIVIGATTKSDVLTLCGPPDAIRRQYDGDLFIYRYFRRNSAVLDIREPLITRLTIFSYSRIQQKADTLVILFGKDGLVQSYAYHAGTSELKRF